MIRQESLYAVLCSIIKSCVKKISGPRIRNTSVDPDSQNNACPGPWSDRLRARPSSCRILFFTCHIQSPSLFLSRMNLDNPEDYFFGSLLNSNMADTRPMSYLRGCNLGKNDSQRMNVAKKGTGETSEKHSSH